MRLKIISLCFLLVSGLAKAQWEVQTDLGASFHVGPNHFYSSDGKVEDQAFFAKSLKVVRNFSKAKNRNYKIGLRLAQWGVQSTRLIYPATFSQYSPGSQAKPGYLAWATTTYTTIGVPLSYFYNVNEVLSFELELNPFYTLFETRSEYIKEDNTMFPDVEVDRNQTHTCVFDYANLEVRIKMQYSPRTWEKLGVNFSFNTIPIPPCNFLGYFIGTNLGMAYEL